MGNHRPGQTHLFGCLPPDAVQGLALDLSPAREIGQRRLLSPCRTARPGGRQPAHKSLNIFLDNPAARRRTVNLGQVNA